MRECDLGRTDANGCRLHTQGAIVCPPALRGAMDDMREVLWQLIACTVLFDEAFPWGAHKIGHVVDMPAS